MRLLIVVLIAAILAAGSGQLFPRSTSLSKQGEALDVSSALEALMGRYHELGEFNGSVLVVRQGQTLLNQGFGYADMEKKIANGPETRFLIGSLSKQFTAVMILKLVEMGRLSLDATLAEVLPYYRKDTGAKVTVRHLLEHTSGIPCFTRQMRDVRVCPTIKEFVLKYCSGNLDSEPGASFRYSNGGFVILGAVIEQAAGLSYEQALRRYVLFPLGMNATGLGREGMPLPQAARGYQRRAGRVVAAGPVDPFLAYSAGGMVSTTTDIARWENAFYRETVLSSEMRAILSSAPANDYFCGQRFKRQAVGPGRAERDIVSHGGRILGFNSLLLRIPRERIFIVLFNNTDSTRLETMAAGLLEILYGRVPHEPHRSLAEELRVAQKGKGIAAALRDLRELCRKEGALNDPEPEEIQLTAFGYELLEGKKYPDALDVFSFLVEQFPKSWNAYDSLAEAQAAAGLDESAHDNYAKSLELNPTNKNAETQLRKLKEN